MSEFVENFEPLGNKHLIMIDKNIERGADVILRSLEEYEPYTYYSQLWYGSPPVLRDAIRKLTTTFYPKFLQANGQEKRHPFADTAEQGIIVGTTFAYTALGRARRDQFFRDTAESFDKMSAMENHNPYDLEDILQRTGESTRLMLTDRFGEDIFEIDDPYDDDRRCNLYANAIGFMGALTITRFTELCMYDSQPRDSRAIDELSTDVATLTNPEYTLSFDDLRP